MRKLKRAVLAVAILAGGLVSGPARFGWSRRSPPEPPRETQQEQTATEAALPLTLAITARAARRGMGRRSGVCRSCVRRHRTSGPALCRAGSSTRCGYWISPTRTAHIRRDAVRSRPG